MKPYDGGAGGEGTWHELNIFTLHLVEGSCTKGTCCCRRYLNRNLTSENLEVCYHLENLVIDGRRGLMFRCVITTCSVSMCLSGLGSFLQNVLIV